ncbi:MAG: PKD domain-containing protein [Gemmatimonadaceae bacterium]|nr:PKD domain-containing protein [Chitinophagaceae bacterium]
MSRKSSFSRIDENVYFTMGGTGLLALIILLVRYGTSTECFPIKLIIDPGPYLVNTRVQIKAETKEAKTYKWDFGDGSNSEDGQTVGHSYKKAGKYTVTITVNETCTEFHDLYINEPVPVVKANSLATFLGPQTAYAGTEVVFEDTASSNTAWEWHFEEDGAPAGYEKKARYIYTEPGLKKVWVKLNRKSDEVMFRYIQIVPDKEQEELISVAKTKRTPERVIIVKDKPTEPPLTLPGKTEPEVAKTEPVAAPVKPKAEAITPQQMGDLITDYNEGKKSEGDFNKYFCGNNVSVKYESKFLSFSEFLAKVKKIKKGKIKSVSAEITKDEQNCIQKMEVIIKEKKLFGVF